MELAADVILIYGPGSGAGKTTLARSLHGYLDEQGLSVVLIDENQFAQLPEFEPYIQAIELKRGADRNILLSCCRQFLDSVCQTGSTYVLDSSLPCTDWLVSAGASEAAALEFMDDLLDVCERRGLRPVLGYVRGDLDVFLGRAIEDRRKGWAEDLALERTGSESHEDLLAYFGRLRDVADRVYARWPFAKVGINTEANDIESCRRDLMQAMSAGE